MLIINFSHPLTPEQLEQLARLTQQPSPQVVTINVQFDTMRPFADQAQALVDQVGLSPAAWQSMPLLVALPALNYGAAAVLAELHGRCGYFPPLIRLRPVPAVIPPRFEVAEIVNLQQIRDEARQSRF